MTLVYLNKLSSIRNREHPQGDFNKRANVRHVYSALNSVWRDRATGETLAEVYQGNGTVRVTMFDGQQRADGIGPDTRSAYREAWRAYRLARYDTADLRRQVATLQSQLDGMAQHAALSELPHFRRDIQRTNRRARHAAAIRAHRVLLQRQKNQYEESLSKARRAILDRTTERNAVVSRITRMQSAITEARSKSPELQQALGNLTTDQIEEIVSRLLELAAHSAEYHRRATAAEARAEQAMAGQQSLIAAARAAGLVYTVADTVRFASE